MPDPIPTDLYVGPTAVGPTAVGPGGPIPTDLYSPTAVGPGGLAAAPTFVPSSTQGAMLQGMGSTSPVGMGGLGVGGEFRANYAGGPTPAQMAMAGPVAAPPQNHLFTSTTPQLIRGATDSSMAMAPAQTQGMMASVTQGQAAASPSPWDRVLGAFKGFAHAASQAGQGQQASKQTAQLSPQDVKKIVEALKSAGHDDLAAQVEANQPAVTAMSAGAEAK